MDFSEKEALDGRGMVVIGWSGMRGVVTLAAAQTISVEYPQQPVLVLVAFVVALVTLVVFGSTLPALIRALKLLGTEPDEQRS